METVENLKEIENNLNQEFKDMAAKKVIFACNN